MLQHLPGDLALGLVGRGQLEADRGAVCGAEQVEPEAPEVARVALAVAIGRDPGQLRSSCRLPRGSAGHRRGVQQAQPLAKGRGDEREVVDRPLDLRCEPAHPLGVARLLGQIGEEVAQSSPGCGNETAIVGDLQQGLGDQQGHQLRVADLLRTAPAARTLGQEVVDQGISCREKGVEVGVHRGLQGGVA